VYCEEFGKLPSEIEGEDPGLLERIVQLRAYSRMRDAMRTEKERERDAQPSGPLAELVAKVQHMLQIEDLREQTDAETADEEDEVSG
jgi:hypothetical protein